MVELILSAFAIGVSVASLLVTFKQNKHALKVQLFELRIRRYYLLNALVQAVSEHKTVFTHMFDAKEALAVNARSQLNLLINNTVFDPMYKLLEEKGYQDYEHDVFKLIDNLKQEAASITLVFADNQYSQLAERFVLTYIDVVAGLYEHHVFATKRLSRDNLLGMRTAGIVDEITLVDCKESLERNSVLPNLQKMLDIFNVLEKTEVLNQIKNQVNLSNPKS